MTKRVLLKRELIKLISLVIIISPLLFSCSAYKQSCTDSWQLVYENDKNGNAINGDINDLIKAVSEGKEIRAMIYDDENQYYITEAENIWLKNNIVHIQNTSNISVQFIEDKLFIQDNTYHFFFTFNTNGDFIASRWYVGEHKARGKGTYKRYGKWFIK